MIRSKLPDVGVTIFTQMSRLANECGAINLSQGFPNFSVDPALIELVERHMRQGRNQYAPMQGVELLRERLAEKARDLYGASYDPASEITVTSGATEAIFVAITASVRPGDEVILFEPVYDSYVPAVLLCGGVPVPVRMSFPDYRIPWDEVERSLTEKTRLIIINSPHNPSGAVLAQTDIARLRSVLSKTAALVLSDEVYEHIIFDGLAHESMARYPDLASRSFIAGSFGKTYHATGWKVGYCMAPAALTEEFRKIHQYVTFATSTPVQCALADILPRRELYLELGAFYQKKRDLFSSMLGQSRFRPLACSGTYFQMLDYSAISDEPDAAFARRITEEHGVASIPPSVFYGNGEDYRVLRFCFAKDDETLERAAERLCRI